MKMLILGFKQKYNHYFRITLKMTRLLFLLIIIRCSIIEFFDCKLSRK